MATLAPPRTTSPTTPATGQSTLLVMCDELSADQEAALLELHPEVSIITEKSPELALGSFASRRRIRKHSPDSVIIVVHEGCTHLASRYAYRQKDYATKRVVWNQASDETIKVRRNNHLWLGILELTRSFLWDRRTTGKQIDVQALLLRQDNSVEPLVAVNPRTWKLNRACSIAR